MRKSIYIILVFALLSITAKAQQTEQSNLYEFNLLKINPAFAGNEGCGNVSVGHLSQWAGFDGAPQTSYVNGSGQIGKNMALGGKVALDRLGTLTRFNAQGIYSYKVNFGNDHNLRLGIGAGINQHNFNFSGSNIEDLTDESLILGNEKGLSFYSEFGIVYSIKSFQFSFSLPNLVETRSKLSPTTGEISNTRHMTAYMGYRIGKSSKITVTPSILYRNSAAFIHQLEGNVLLDFKDRFQFGVGYRHKSGILGRVGLNINDLVQVRYAYEFALTDIARASSGSHEVSIGLTLCKNGRKDIQVVPVDHIVETDPVERIITVTDTVIVEAASKTDTVIVEKIVEVKVGGRNGKHDLDYSIYYGHAKSDFDEEKHALELDKIVTYLSENKDEGVYIQGYTSEDGSEFTNFKLSGERSKKIYLYLLSKGVERKQMISIVRGESTDFNDADFVTDDDKNRRVQIISW